MKRRFNAFFISFIDIIVVVSAFLIVAWLKQGTKQHLLSYYWKPAFIYTAVWFFISTIGGKYSIQARNSFRKICSIVFFSDFFVLAIVSIFMVVFIKMGLSRIIIFGITMIAFTVEIFLWLLYWLIRGKRNFLRSVRSAYRQSLLKDIVLPQEPDTDTAEGLKQLRQQNIPKITYELIEFIILDLILFVAAFLFTAWIKDATRRLVIPTYWKPMVICSVIWLLVSFFSEKFYCVSEENYRQSVGHIDDKSDHHFIDRHSRVCRERVPLFPACLFSEP